MCYTKAKLKKSRLTKHIFKKFMKKTLFALALCSVILTPALTRAATVEELQAQIQSLLKQIQALQTQLSSQQNAFCYTFNQNLRFGDGGGGTENKEQDVRNLQTVLEKEGFQVDDSEQKGGSVFEESTAAAVVGFQEKYRDEILTPNRLSRGTGYVGPSTRIKLNKLYGCGSVSIPQPLPTPTPSPVQPPITQPIIPPATPQITVVSPNGGEKWTTGQNYTITWRSQSLTGNVGIYFAFPDGGLCAIGSTPVSWETFTFALKENHPCTQIPRTITAGNYRVALYANNGNPNVDWVAKDTSDGDITISSPVVTQQPTITVLSPNGGETLTPDTYVKIRWTYSPLPPSNFAINLQRADRLESVGQIRFCDSSTYYQEDYPNHNTFWYSWRVGYDSSGNKMNISDGQYRVMVYNCGDVKDVSDQSFSIVTPQPSITVLTPNGGEQLAPGQNYNITWYSTGISNVKIQLCGTSNYLGYICNQMSGSAGISIGAAQKSYIWYLDPNHPYFPSDTLKIKISSVDSSTNNIFDESNSTFSVH